MKIVISKPFETQRNIYDTIIESPSFILGCTITGVLLASWIYSKIPLIIFYYDHP